MQFQHFNYLDKQLKSVANNFGKQQLFVVGGAVRDLLLGINTDPTDIDMTLAADPEKVFTDLQKLSRDEYSLFRTEKYGTITLIEKEQQTTFEFTPFREEGGYSDNRHPDEIRRSDSLLADAKRRDFTINCLYYTSVGKLPGESNDRHYGNGDDIVRVLTKQGWCFISEYDLLILQDHELIERFFKDGIFQRDEYVNWISEHGIHASEGVRFIVDPFGGLQDLNNGHLRAVGDPEARFREDALRLLRGVRLVNTINQKLTQGNFDFEKETWKSMKGLHHLVSGLAKERLHQEIVKVFKGKNPFGWIAVIDEIGLLQILFPALHRNKYDEQPVRYHPFDTYSHILLTLWHLQQINDDYLVKLGMLYHDVGKKDQYEEYAKATTKEEQQAIHSSPANHVVSGPVHVETDFRALGFSNKEIEEVQFYVAQHMRPGQILTAREDNQVKRMRQLLSEYGYERVKNLLDITVADRRGQYNPLQSKEVDAVDSLYKILDKLYDEEGQFTRRQLAVNGDDIMQEFGLTPSPRVKELLDNAFEWVLPDISNRNDKKAVLSYLRNLDK